MSVPVSDCTDEFTLKAIHVLFNRLQPLALNRHVLVLTLIVFPAMLSSLLHTIYSIPVALLIALSLFHGTLLSSIALYRLSPLHPLAQYPGPTLLKLSTLLQFWLSRDGQRHLRIQGLHRQYRSEVIRIGGSAHMYSLIAQGR